MINLILCSIQQIFVFCFKVLSLFFIGIEVEGRDNLAGLKGPLIVASNHTSWADPFLIVSSLPLRLSPIRYSVLNKIYYPVCPFLWILGAFPVKRGIGLDNSLKHGLKILNKKGVVGIFPQGKRQWKQGPFISKRGVAYLALKTKSRIVPVRIKTPVLKMTVLGVIFKRYKINIKIGKVFHSPDKKINKVEDYNDFARMVMDRINML